jgi:hypothetical protein
LEEPEPRHEHEHDELVLVSSLFLMSKVTGTMAESAASRVFAIEELLESVLIYISIDRLLILRRVCTQFNRVIRTSPQLLKIQFLRPAPLRKVREHNPLFEDYCKDIAYADPDSKTSSAQLNITPTEMRRLLDQCPQSWRNMIMFQPPAPYWFIMPSVSMSDINVKFLNDANVPLMHAIEKASWIIELEVEKKRKRRSTLDQALRGGFARVLDGRLLKQGEKLKRRIDELEGPAEGLEMRQQSLEIASSSSG